MKKEQSVEIGTDKSEETLLTQWQTCVEMANAVSQRRDAMNNLFCYAESCNRCSCFLYLGRKTIMLLVSGIIVCVVWIFLYQKFQRTEQGKV